MSNFVIEYVSGAMPVLNLKEADGTVGESLSITLWKTETLVEFLHDRLLPVLA